MQSNSIRGRALKAGRLIACWGWGLAAAVSAQAGQYQLLEAQPNTVVVAANVQNAEQVCHLEISVQGQPAVERVVRAPDFEARIDITPQDVESVAVSWRGKFKRLNGEAVNACPTQGNTRFRVVSDNLALQAAWRSVFQGMGAAKAQCVRTALQRGRVRYDWFDMAAMESSPEDGKIQRAQTACDAFLAQKKAWGEQNPQGFACTLPGGVKSRCEGFFSVTEKGKAVPISFEAAIGRQLDHLPWGTGVRETAAAQVARQKQAQALQAKLRAEEEAQAKAQEEALVREAQMAQERQEAQARERKEKAEADRARRLQEIERLEQERLEKRSWVLKQLEKLRRDPPADPKSETKPDAKADPKAEAKPDAKADPKADAKADPKTEAPKPP